MVEMHGVAPLLAFALFIGFHSLAPKGVQSIGVCNGMVGDNLPPPTDVVHLYKSLGITQMRIYAPNAHVLAALRGSGIGLILGVANEDLAGLAANPPMAASWVHGNVKPYYPAVNIRYLAVGNRNYTRAAVQSIGVCYGMVGNDLPSSSDVVQLYRFKGIKGMRIYSPVRSALDALRNSGIGLILDTGNGDVLGQLASSSSFAASWVQNNVKPYYPSVNIKYIAVGNEVDGGATQSILPAMRNLNAALAAQGLSGIKVSTTVQSGVITNSFPPSSGVFAQGYMVDIARYLATTGAPLLANVYPYFAYRGNPRDISLGYATFQPGTTVTDSGNGLTYTNLLDAMMDAVVAALEKAGAGGVRVVVSESGWPSAGGFAASVDNARSYNQGLIDHVGRGTPKRPGALETYIFAMFNENQKNGDPTERNFGLFYPNKQPVYPIRF